MKSVRWMIYIIVIVLAVTACRSSKTDSPTPVVNLPLLDNNIPKSLETATFALG